MGGRPCGIEVELVTDENVSTVCEECGQCRPRSPTVVALGRWVGVEGSVDVFHSRT